MHYQKLSLGGLARSGVLARVERAGHGKRTGIFFEIPSFLVVGQFEYGFIADAMNVCLKAGDSQAHP